VWHVLEESFELVLANAMHIRNVPGRKTDVNDATWIPDLLAHGLIRASIVPPTTDNDPRHEDADAHAQAARPRASAVRAAAQKTLEDAKSRSRPSSATSPARAASPPRLFRGETDPERLLAVATGRLRADRKTLAEALS
jgi:transposase